MNVASNTTNLTLYQTNLKNLASANPNLLCVFGSCMSPCHTSSQGDLKTKVFPQAKDEEKATYKTKMHHLVRKSMKAQTKTH